MPISEAHVESYLEHGYVVVENLLDPATLRDLQEEVSGYFPTFKELRRHPERYPHLGTYGEPCLPHAPFSRPGLNRVAAYPALLGFMRRILGSEDIRLEQSHLMAKYAGVEDFEQLHHLDFGSHTLTYPRDDGVHRIIPVVIYYSDTRSGSAPTRVVSRTVTDRCFETPFAGRTGQGRSPFGGSNLRWQLHPDEVPEAYAQEVEVRVPAGGALIYGMRTFHRGTGFREDGARFAHFLSYRAEAAGGAGYEGWARGGPDEALQRFITEGPPEARALLGFPPPGHPYWNDEMIRGVAARYPGIDMEPYRRALASSAG